MKVAIIAYILAKKSTLSIWINGILNYLPKYKNTYSKYSFGIRVPHDW
jgi:hypothetical protein